MKTVTLNIPDSVEMNELDITMLLASQLYERGKLSLGQAADMAGLSKRTFIELLGKYGISVFNYPASDLTRDIHNA
jgi:predicted HTH domain antitoxin